MCIPNILRNNIFGYNLSGDFNVLRRQICGGDIRFFYFFISSVRIMRMGSYGLFLMGEEWPQFPPRPNLSPSLGWKLNKMYILCAYSTVHVESFQGNETNIQLVRQVFFPKICILLLGVFAWWLFLLLASVPQNIGNCRHVSALCEISPQVKTFKCGYIFLLFAK